MRTLAIACNNSHRAKNRVLTLLVSTLFFFEKLYNKSYFEAGRSPRNRSILGVCEDFEGKPDAKRALLDSFFFIALFGIVYSTDTPCCDVAEYHKGQNPYV